MRITENIHLDYSDVLIKPSNSKVYSRKDVDLTRKFYFPISGQYWEGIPIIAANMDTVGTYEMYKVLSKYKIITCFHKFYKLEDFKEMDLDPNFFMISTGINEDDVNRLAEIINEIEVKFICVDVANGYMEKLIQFCSNLRELFPNKIIIAGNVVCANRTKELIKYGKVDIVKVGIGSGCFDSETKILLSNATYKKIIDIKEGDSVINKDGKSVKVLKNIYKGKKNVININNNNFLDNTLVTPDHNYWIGNLNNLSINTIKKSSIVNLFKRNNSEKFKWEEISKIYHEKQFNLLPKNINWDLPDNLKIDLIDFKNKNNLYDDRYIYINDIKVDRYLSIDNKFGKIIGNYLYNINNIRNIRNHINTFKISEILNTNETLIKNLLNSINSNLPEKYYNKNKEFIIEFYKGIINLSDEDYKMINIVFK